MTDSTYEEKNAEQKNGEHEHSACEFQPLKCNKIEYCVYPPRPQTSGADHEPPVGGGEGSFYFTFEQGKIRLPINPKDLSPALTTPVQRYGTEYNIYPFQDSTGTNRLAYKGVAEVRILGERLPKGRVEYLVYKVPEIPAANVNLWLHEPTAKDPAPDIIAQGVDGAFLTRKSMIRSPLSGPGLNRARYYDKSISAPDSDSDRPHIKLVQWSLVLDNNTDLNDYLCLSDEHEVLYMHIFFHDKVPHKSLGSEANEKYVRGK